MDTNTAEQVETVNPPGAEKRLGIDEYFIEIAKVVAKRATCPRLKVGAVLVRDKMLLSTGYNGAPRGLPHCTDEGCKLYKGHCVRTVHAESNAVAQAAFNGTKTYDSTLYVTHLSCHICLKLLINAGVKRIVYVGKYEVKGDKHEEANAITQEFIKDSNLVVERFKKG